MIPESPEHCNHLLDFISDRCAGYFLRYAAYFYRFYILYATYHPLLCLCKAEKRMKVSSTPTLIGRGNEGSTYIKADP
jgi:hypothetical protein